MTKNEHNTTAVPKTTDRTNKSMSFEDAVGLPYLNTPFDDFYDAVIEYLGGVNAIKPFVPAEKEEIKQTLEKDHSLNSIPIKKWDAASGFEFQGAKCIRKPNKFQALLLENGIRVYSPSECVCLLKRTAERIARE